MSSSAPLKKENQPFQSQFIRAGAGAGKTTQLIQSFFAFVEDYKKAYNKYPKIVITTFTRKATQEVKERLLVFALNSKDTHLVNYINKKSSVHISTIHGLLSLLVNRYHSILGLHSRLNVLNDKSFYKVYRKILQEIIVTNEEYVQLLDTFKFKIVLNQLRYYVEKRSVNNINFVSSNLFKTIRQIKLDSFLAEFEIIINNESIFSSHQAWNDYYSFLKSFYSYLNNSNFDYDRLYNMYVNRPSKPRFLTSKPVFDSIYHDIIVKYFSSDADFINENDTDLFIEKNESLNKLFFEVAEKFFTKLKIYSQETGQISINDLESYSLVLLTEHFEKIKSFSTQFNYYMIDEYQDTSPLQDKILKLLIGLNTQFIVGDPQQSIYLFRGAQSSIFKNKEIEAQARNFKFIDLNTNYRSEPKLMNWINHIMSTFSNQFGSMAPKHIDLEILQENTQAYYIKTTNEFESIINQIIRLRFQGAKYTEICILFTKNSDIFDFSQYASEHHIPVHPVISAGFDQKREILDLVSFLRFLVNPFDHINLITLLRSPWLTVTDSEIFLMRQANKSLSLWKELHVKKHPDADFLQKCIDIYNTLGVMTALDFFVKQTHFLVFSYKLDPTGQRESNIYKFITDLNQSSKNENFLLNSYLSTQFKSFSEDLGSNLNESLALFTHDQVQAMTIHAAKGLQFPHVIISGLQEKPKQTNQFSILYDDTTSLVCLPVLNSESIQKWSNWGELQKIKLNQAEEQEFERLFYVAVTRAQKSVTLIWDTSKQKSKKSWASKIDWLEEGKHDFDHFSVQSLIDSEEAAQKEIIVEENSLPHESIKIDLNEISQPFQIQFQKVAKTSVTEMLSKSELVIQTESLDNDLIINLQKAQKGTDLHRFFESMKYSQINIDEQDHNLTDDLSKMLKWFKQIHEIPFIRILEQGYPEWGFGLMSKQGLIKGQIDLWSIVDNIVYILDYKTGSSNYSDKAFEQLAVYARCLKQMKKIMQNHNIQLISIYPLEKIVKIRHLLFTEILEV